MTLTDKKKNILGWALAAIAFCIPVYMNALPVLIVLLILTWLIAVPVTVKKEELKKNLTGLAVLTSLFLIYLIGIAYTGNQQEGWQKMETSLSLIIFPLVLLTSFAYRKAELHKILRYFVMGCLLSLVISYSYSTFCFLYPEFILKHKLSDYDYGGYFFWKDRLSPLFHTSYLSMFFNIAIAILIFKAEEISISGYKRFVLLTLFAFTVLLLSSRAGLMVLGVMGPVLLWQLFREKNFKAIAISVLLALSVFSGLFFGAEQFAKRFSTMFALFTGNSGNADKGMMRFEIWPAAWETAIDNLPFGAGIGDANDVLYEKYKEKGLTVEYEKKTNAHNQFLQTGIAAGLPGITALLLLIIYPILRAGRSERGFQLLFAFILLFNFAFESMLQTQAGVISFAFLNTLIFRLHTQKE